MINAIQDRSKKFQIIWDLGRRCTYACSYCPPNRNNKWSPLVSFDELKKNMDSLDDYCSLYDNFRKKPLNKSLSFTGGEPTAHPDFFKFMKYIKEEYPEYRRGLTTNGAFSKRKLDLCKEFITGGTISYHPEGTEKQNKLVLHNILELKDTFKVNVMFHKDYFDVCVEICDMLKANGVSYVPRIIGDEAEDDYGVKMGYAHVYNDTQMQWFKDYWRKPKQPAPKLEEGSTNTQKSLGRPCCGNRTFSVHKEDDGWEDSKFLPETDFNDWNCMVNWYFLYIHQELDMVWTHQTCGVNLNNEVAPMGKWSEMDKIVEDLEEKMLVDQRMPIIRCPKHYCGCGMCIDKAKGDINSIELFNAHTIDVLKPYITKKVDVLEWQELTTKNAFKAAGLL